jgi:hypothetical protein
MEHYGIPESQSPKDQNPLVDIDTLIEVRYEIKSNKYSQENNKSNYRYESENDNNRQEKTMQRYWV